MTPRAPRSLLWRLGSFALAVALVSLLLHVAAITFWLRPIGERLIAHLAARVQLTQSLLQATDAAHRDRLIDALRDGDFQLGRGAWTGDAPPRPPVPMGALLIDRLGPEFKVVQEGPAQGPLPLAPVQLRMDFMVDNEPWHVRLSAQPPTWALLGTGIGWLLLTAMGVAASLLIGLRFIVDPIRQVAQRIATQGATMQPLTAPSRASAEVRSLVESFNRLAERVQSADRTKQHLLAGVSHDLRTPLARLRLRIETQCEPAVAEAAEVELHAIERIVSQFLDYVHGDTPRKPAMGESLRATVEQVVASYAEQGVHIALKVTASDIQVPAVEAQRLLNNLIDNALAHGVQPIHIGWQEKAHGEHELSVWDHGAGLTDQQFKLALEPFVRLSNDAGIGHCGLGLAIVARIAQLWQARLECRREPPNRFGVVVTWRDHDRM
jgi:two-component system, OmpR family, osmolarity sensor histidine kinase EnvZ